MRSVPKTVRGLWEARLGCGGSGPGFGWGPRHCCTGAGRALSGPESPAWLWPGVRCRESSGGFSLWCTWQGRGAVAAVVAQAGVPVRNCPWADRIRTVSGAGIAVFGGGVLLGASAHCAYVGELAFRQLALAGLVAATNGLPFVHADPVGRKIRDLALAFAAAFLWRALVGAVRPGPLGAALEGLCVWQGCCRRGPGL